MKRDQEPERKKNRIENENIKKTTRKHINKHDFVCTPFTRKK